MQTELMILLPVVLLNDGVGWRNVLTALPLFLAFYLYRDEHFYSQELFMHLHYTLLMRKHNLTWCQLISVVMQLLAFSSLSQKVADISFTSILNR